MPAPDSQQCVRARSFFVSGKKKAQKSNYKVTLLLEGGGYFLSVFLSRFCNLPCRLAPVVNVFLYSLYEHGEGFLLKIFVNHLMP